MREAARHCRSISSRSSTDATRLLLGIALCVSAASGCDHFRVEPFHGSKILMTLSGLPTTAPGHHVELWARESPDGSLEHQYIDRLLAADGSRRPDGHPCGKDETCVPAAYAIAPAVAFSGSGESFQLTDGCMIDAAGHLLWQPEASPREGDAPQGELGAKAVLRRIHQLTDGAASPLLALVSIDDHEGERPAVDESQPPAERLAACQKFWGASPWAYSGNPFQLTAPVHGQMYGPLDFTSVDPPQILGGIAITSDWALHDAVELWLTDSAASIADLDPSEIDCATRADTCRGRVLLDGAASPGGRNAIHFELSSPSSASAGGSATIQVRLDEDAQPF